MDEWQAVPEVLGAVKRSVDTDPSPGRFVLTGSVSADLDATTWPGTALPRLFPLRQQDGRREVDILSELGADRVIGLEVRASAAPDAGDANHLRWLRDELGDRFVEGVVLHTGPTSHELSERIVALPISALWSSR